ncbi:hypothetical protein CHS0354_014158 [Potamilus streckersoni]|uniref:Centrosomal protein of 192 kDa n=1 Tax=Potamilus streckersoni TaxID=2493646 RepID=A0AAE0SBI0_9BIVA|nr:hypothetical protein CHS0354_014158 [Potamilus streckersoni]
MDSEIFEEPLAEDGLYTSIGNESQFQRSAPLAASTVSRDRPSKRPILLENKESFLDNDFSYRSTTSVTDDRDKPQQNLTFRNEISHRQESSLGILKMDELDIFSEMGDLTNKYSFKATAANEMGLGTQGSSQEWQERSSSKQDSKQDQPFAMSQEINTVRKMEGPKHKGKDPLGGIRQSLFSNIPLGEESEVNQSVYEVELEEEDLNRLDDDFGDFGGLQESSDEESPKKQKSQQQQQQHEDLQLDSKYLCPAFLDEIGDGDEGITDEEVLPYLSKVSLFDDTGENGQEESPNHELEMVQGMRQEAAGEDSGHEDNGLRPGLEGVSAQDSEGQLPMDQRQSAEGDVVESPVPGDGGGGGDGSSGTDSDDGIQQSLTEQARILRNRFRMFHPIDPAPVQQDHQGQRVRPMGDDLLTEMNIDRFDNRDDLESNSWGLESRFFAPSSSHQSDDTQNSQNLGAQLQSRFLATMSPNNLESPTPSDQTENEGSVELSSPGSPAPSGAQEAVSLAQGEKPGTSTSNEEQSSPYNDNDTDKTLKLEDLSANDARDETLSYGPRAIESLGARPKETNTDVNASAFRSSSNLDLTKISPSELSKFFLSLPKEQDPEDLVKAYLKTTNHLPRKSREKSAKVEHKDTGQGQRNTETELFENGVKKDSTTKTSPRSKLPVFKGSNVNKIAEKKQMSKKFDEISENSLAEKIPHDVARDLTRSLGSQSMSRKHCSTKFQTHSDPPNSVDLVQNSASIDEQDSSRNSGISNAVESNSEWSSPTVHRGNSDVNEMLQSFRSSRKKLETDRKSSTDTSASSDSQKWGQFKTRDSGVESLSEAESSKQTWFVRANQAIAKSNELQAEAQKELDLRVKTDSYENLEHALEQVSERETPPADGQATPIDFTGAGTLTLPQRFQTVSPAGNRSQPDSAQVHSPPVLLRPEKSESVEHQTETDNKKNAMKKTLNIEHNVHASNLQQGPKTDSRIFSSHEGQRNRNQDFRSTDHVNSEIVLRMGRQEDDRPTSHSGSSSRKIKLTGSIQGGTAVPTLAGEMDNKTGFVRQDKAARAVQTSVGRFVMAGHHIPDGTEYSLPSDYSHVDHRGMLRDDLIGISNIGLAESRGFDAILGKQNKLNHKEVRQTGPLESIREFGQTGRFMPSLSQDPDILFSSRRIQYDPQEQVSRKMAQNVTSESTISVPYTRSFDAAGPETIIGDDSSTTNEGWVHPYMTVNSSVSLSDDSSDRSGPISPSRSSVNPSRPSVDRNPGPNPPVVITESSNTLESTSQTNIFKVPQAPISSFRHNLLPSHPKSSTKPVLLSRDSMLHTDFAQEYLKRDAFAEYRPQPVVRPIPRSLPGDVSHQEAETLKDRFQHPQPANDAQNHVPYERQISHLSQQSHLDFTAMSISHAPPTYHSTPFNGYTAMDPGRIRHTILTPFSDATGLSVRSPPAEENLSTQQPEDTRRGQARQSLCPIEAPGTLNFSEVCCVGISTRADLELKNPTGRWLECFLSVGNLSLDGQTISIEYFPFEMRRKVIIEPNSVEIINVIFIPKLPGAYVAQVKIVTQSFLKKHQVELNAIPVEIIFQAIAETPKIQVASETGDLINFGHMSWGSNQMKTIELRNIGRASVPLRLAISSSKAWHCFSFSEKDLRTADISIISRSSRPQSPALLKTIINLCLPGIDNQKPKYHEVCIYCKPPEKHCDRAMAQLPPEEFTARVDVEVDIPSSRLPVLKSLKLQAVVGVAKLHIPKDLQVVELKTVQNQPVSKAIKLKNAGNIDLQVSQSVFEHQDLISVLPALVTIGPGKEEEAIVTLKPKGESIECFKTHLLLYLEPDGPLYEIQLLGEVTLKTSSSAPQLLSDKQSLVFGGVALGSYLQKQLHLLNQDEHALALKISIRSDCLDFQLQNTTSNQMGLTSQEIVVESGQKVPVYVIYAPSSTCTATGKLAIKPQSGSFKYSVPLSGYGGVAQLRLQNVETSLRQDHYWISMGQLTDGRQVKKHCVIQNTGSRPASVQIASFMDKKCRCPLPAGRAYVSPAEKFQLKEKEVKTLSIVLMPTEREVCMCLNHEEVVAVMEFSYRDIVDNGQSASLSKMTLSLVGAASLTASVYSTPHVSERCKTKSREVLLPQPPPPQQQRGPEQRAIPSAKPQEMPSNIGVHDVSVVPSKGPHRSDDSAARSLERMTQEKDTWIVQPDQMVLYSPAYGPIPISKFKIINFQDRELRFELSWPGGWFCVTPSFGIVEPRSSTSICISSGAEVMQKRNLLPLSDSIYIKCGGQYKSLKVQIRDDVVPEDSASLSNSTLVPLYTSHSATQSICLPPPRKADAKSGGLETSTVEVKFPTTASQSQSDTSIELKNTSDSELRWLISSFASPYVKGADSSKDIFRANYKVFDFSKQFGKLSANESMQVIIQFRPRSQGTFSQYWDIQTRGDHSESGVDKDFIRIHLLGERNNSERGHCSSTV